jgi:hypothetical protein
MRCSRRDTKVARNSTEVSLAISEGCTDTGPTTSQRVAPFARTPRTITPTRSTMVAKKSGNDILRHHRSGIIAATTIATTPPISHSTWRLK